MNNLAMKLRWGPLQFCCLLMLGGLGKQLVATTYSGASATNGDSALYYSLSQSPANGDSYNGYVSFNAGLTIPSSATVTLNSVGLFGGVLNFAADGSSVLALGQSLKCRSDFSVTNNGHIAGAGNTLKLSGNLNLSTQIILDSDVTIDGQGNRVTIASGGVFALGNRGLTLRNMDLVIQVTTPFTAAFGTLLLENVKIYLSGADSSFGLPVTVQGSTIIYGQGRTLWVSNLTINDATAVIVSTGVTLAATGTVSLSTANSLLALDGCTLDVTSAGLTLSTGVLTFANQVLVLATGKTLRLGGGADIAVKVLGGAYVIVDGTLYHNPS